MKKILNLFRISPQRSTVHNPPEAGRSTAKPCLPAGRHEPQERKRHGFSLVELLVVVVIIGILSGVAYIGIQRAKTNTMNDKVLDDVIGIANALERYNQDHFGIYPVPEIDGNMNVSCFYADATYAHDCDTSAFRQGMIDNNLLTRRYMPDVPTDPRTGSRYVYGVSTDGKYFMVGGNYEESDGSFIAKTSGNLKKGYHLPSLIRAFNGPNFVVENGTNLPYSPDHLIITATLQNMTDSSVIDINDADGDPITTTIENGMKVYTGYEIFSNGSTLDIYYSDGSISSLDTGSSMEILEGTEVEENDEDGIITKIRIKLTSGKIWNKVARLASASEFNVETTSAIAGVRGTEFGADVNNDFLVYSGSICPGGVKTCASPIEVDPGNPPVTMNLETAIVVTNTGLGTLMTAQTKRYLNDNIRPHIKSVDGLTMKIKVANLRTYYDLPNGVNLETNGLAVRDKNGNDLTSNLHLDTALLASIDDYELEITDTTYENPITLHFVGLGGPDSGDSIPITITADTFLTEEDLYAVEDEGVIGEEEAEGCTAADIIIAGDINYNVAYNAIITWSVTPPACAGHTFDVYFGESTSMTITDKVTTAPISDMHYTVSGAHTPSIEYFYEVHVVDLAGVDPVVGSKIVPTTPTWCGDGAQNGDEQCDSTSATPGEFEGCNAPGPDACTCNGDLGWKPIGSGGCECDDGSSTPMDDTDDAVITLPSHIDDVIADNEPIPINSSLIWEVSPACVFEGAGYAVYIEEDGTALNDIKWDGPLTYFSLTTPLSPELMPGDIYDWKISSEGFNSVIGSFEVQCPEDSETIVLTSPKASYPDIDISSLYTVDFIWEESEPACLFDATDLYTLTVETVPPTTPVCSNQYAGSSKLDTACVTAITAGQYTWKIERDTNTLPASGLATSTTDGEFTITATTPAPVISGLGIDCSGGTWPDHCMSGGEVYPVEFTVTNADSCSATATLQSGFGIVGDIVSPVTTTGFDYNTGTYSDSGDVIQITVTCTGPGGTTVDTDTNNYINETLE